MTKILKITARIVGLLLEWLLVFILFLAFGIRTSPVQTYIAQQLTAYLSDELGAKFHVEKVDIIFLDKVELQGVFAQDLDGDTLLYAGSLYLELHDYDLDKKYFRFSEVEIDNSRIGIKEDTAGVYNYRFILDYFASDKKKKTPPTIVFDQIKVHNTCFSWDDNRKKRKEYGMDYFHIRASSIETLVEDFKIAGRTYTGFIRSLQCVEKSGFELKDFNTGVKVDSTGVYLSELFIQAKGSKIEAKKFNMVCTGFTDFRSFVDSVSFDARVDQSTIDLSEASLFAPILRGMNDTVRLRTALSKKVKNLRLSDFYLRIKKKTRIAGTFDLPDYRKFEQGFFHEKVSRAFIDVSELKKIRLPDASPQRYIQMNERFNRLAYFDVTNANLDGFYSQFVVAAEKVKTKLGDIRMDNGLMFTENPEHGSYLFERSGASNYDVKVENFLLGTFLSDPSIGVIDGFFFLSGEAYSISDIRFSSIEGDIKRFDYLDYSYENITVIDGELHDNIFKGKIDVNDDNLDLTYDGMVDFNGELHLLFTVDVHRAVLDQLNLTKENKEISAVFNIDLRGKNPNDFRGSVLMNSFELTQKEKVITIPELELRIDRSPEQDEFTITSAMANGYLRGKLDANYIMDDLNYQISRVLPSYYGNTVLIRDEKHRNHFDFYLKIDEAEDFMFIVYPDLKVAPGTTLSGHYYAESTDLSANLSSDLLVYKDMQFVGAQLRNTLSTKKIDADFRFTKFVYTDSVEFNDIGLHTIGLNNNLKSALTWEEDMPTASSITWNTEVLGLKHYSFLLEPSHFYVLENRWDIAHASNFVVENDTIRVGNFDLKRGLQSINLNGTVSGSDEHRLDFKLNNFVLQELSPLISEVPLEGTINAWGHISNPFNNFQFVGDANILEFKTRNQLVGDINVNSKWIKSSQSLALQGDLNYQGNRTFDFIGDYYPNRKRDNLDFNLFFEYTDIQFTNALMNPELVSEIHGLLNGSLKVTGTPDEPILDGTVYLLGGSAKVELLGTHFGIEGPISADEYGFYINGIPVFDEDGNAGMLIGSINHDNFKDFNFDMLFDLEVDALNKDPLQPWVNQPLDKFLLLKSEYQPGDVYYGTGYARGVINVFGYTDNLEVTVDLETRKGTKIDIPMYGRGDIEEEDFIIFIDRDTNINFTEPKIDFTGVDLDLNFHVTKDAELKIIFNEVTNDEITAHGNGEIDIALNNIGDVTMNGLFTVADGIYDFAMGPVKEKFYIKEGGSISWTGDPYDALLNMATYYRVNANIATATNDQFGSGSGSRQEILCYLNIKESLSKPAIGFDLEAPGADEEARSIITRIKNDPDELSRQFFSLVLWKTFQPLAGSAFTGNNAAIDLVTNQINAILNKVSDDYTLNLNVDSDNLTGDNTYEFGVSKGFLDDRLILSGSFGVENRKTDESSNQNSIIGDLNLEYLLNESGTFRINIFNESNDKTIIQNSDQSSFTQGVGLYYKEDFHTLKDFKAVQYFLDIFRKKANKRYPIKRKRKQTPVPNFVPKPDAVLPDETNPPS